MVVADMVDVSFVVDDFAVGVDVVAVTVVSRRMSKNVMIVVNCKDTRE